MFFNTLSLIVETHQNMIKIRVFHFYTGIEPFSKTYKGLENIKNELKLDNVTLYNDVAENVLPNLKKEYDIALTSPPYYNLEIYSDEILQVLNNSGETNITLTVRDSKKQDTRRVYFPPLTYGWVPQLKHVVNSAQDGQVYKSTLRSLPSRFSRGEKEHSEIQVTHQGDVSVDVFLDGKILDTYGFDADRYDKNAFITEKEYLPAGCVGNVLQWIQKDGTGEVAMFETNTTLTDRDQPQQEV